MSPDLAQRLEGLGFSALEASVYLCLLRNPGANGSQLAKELQLPRTTVYSVLDALETHSAAFKENGETVRWKAEAPQVLLQNLNRTWQSHMDGLVTLLQAWESQGNEEGYWTISGRSRIQDKITHLIQQAQKEVLLATNWSVDLFLGPMEGALARGVKIHLFSFCEQDVKNLPISFVHHPPLGRKGELDDRVMGVFDQNTVVVASGQGESYQGIWTTHQLMVSLAAEHIHLDMYLMRLREKLGHDPIDDGIRLGSLLEGRLNLALKTQEP